jgi:DNA-binding MarR family transcriptional regulator
MSVRNPDPADVLPDHLARWLDAVSRRLRSELPAHVNDEFPQLRGGHRRILQMIPADGIRITDLAARAQMTKQSLGEFADWLELSGFVRSQRDDADRRVRRLFRTDLGDAASAATERAFSSIEARWRQEIGPELYDTMKQALRQLGRDAFRI